MALRLDVLANTRQFVSEMKKSGASVEDISAALDDMARDGDQATEKLERSFRDLASDASKTGKTIGKDLNDGFDRAKRGMDDFKDESRSTAREAAASFDGSAESISDTFQEIAATAFSGFGPAGEAAGLAIAAGIGVAATLFSQAWDTSAEETEKRIEDMYSRMQEAGNTFLSNMQLQEAINQLDTTEVQKGIDRARELDLERGAVLAAMVGDTQAIADLYLILSDRKQDEVDKIKESGQALEDQQTEIDAVNTKYQEQTDWLRSIQRETDTAADKWQAAKDAVAYVNGQVRTLDGMLANVAKRNVTIGIRADISAVTRDLDYIERRVRNGLSFQITPGRGRFME